MIQKKTTIRCSAAQIITDELLVIEEFALFGVAALTGIAVNLFGNGLALCLDSFNVYLYTAWIINSSIGLCSGRGLVKKSL